MTLAIFIGTLGATLAVGVPVAFALILCALTMGIYLDLFDTQIIAQRLVVGANSFPLLAIPFFLLAGELMNAGGMSKRIIAFASSFLGHRRGGLGFVAILAAVIMASLSGSAAADTAALIAMLLPMMRAAGYDQGRSVGLMAAGGTIAPIIPPSIAYIIFGVATNVSITQLFLAGIVPGLMMGVGLAIVWAIVSRKDNVDVMPRQGWRVRLQTLGAAGWSLGMPVIILGGIRFGIVTPTEAAVVAAVYAIVVGAIIRSAAQRCRYHGRGDASGRSRTDDGVVHRDCRPFRRRHGSRRPAGGQSQAAARSHHADHPRHRHGARHGADHPDPGSGPAACRDCSGYRPGLFRRAVRHQLRHRPHHAAGRHRHERGERCGAHTAA
jgi:MFS family permease